MRSNPRKRLCLVRVLVFLAGLVLVLVSLRTQDQDRVQRRVRDLDQDLNPDLNEDEEEAEEAEDQEEQFQTLDQNQDQNQNQDVNKNLNKNLKKNQNKDQNQNQNKDQNKDQDQKKDQDQVETRPLIPVNRTDIETCIYVPQPDLSPPTPADTTKRKGEYPVDVFSLAQRRRGWVALHVLGMIYMFVALAIVCDEFFVPALEVITASLQISEDVAGATFMAAGGSAPELFTSLIGVFVARSNVGIGTIVGSAVFNILFVIGMCAIFSREMLHLTWWPLFRDVTFYILDLVMLIVFFLDSAILWWESALLVSAYVAYVTFMKFNSQIERAVKAGCRRHKGTVQVWSARSPEKVTEAPPPLLSPSDPDPKPETGPGPGPGPRPGPGPGPRPDSPRIRRTSDPQMDRPRVKTRPVLQRGGSSASLHNASMRNTIFQLMIHTLDPLTEDMPMNGDVKSGSRRVRSRVRPLNTEDNTGPEDGEQKLSSDLPPGPEPSTSHKTIDKTTDKTTGTQQESKIPEETEPSSSSSCSSCSSCSKEEEEGAEEEESAPLSLDWPQTWSKQVSYLLLLPIVFPLWVTVPDVRNQDSRKYFVLTFLGSILWIGVFSYLMVWWAHQVGETVGISEEIMGLTILAAGTSIPDLITSVIVARKGLGDMAVSSSVGSNIFDITVGLPVPWLLFSLSHSLSPVAVSSNGLFCAIVLLFLMLLFVIASIAACRWRMSRALGLTMFFLYFLFLLLSVLLEDRVLTCPVSV